MELNRAFIDGTKSSYGWSKQVFKYIQGQCVQIACLCSRLQLDIGKPVSHWSTLVQEFIANSMILSLINVTLALALCRRECNHCFGIYSL